MFKSFKKMFSKRKTVDPIDKLLVLNENGLQAFVNGDIEYFKNVDKTTYELFLKFRRDFIQSIAEITPEGKFERFKPNVTQDQVSFVTKHARKILEKIVELKNTNKQLKGNFIENQNQLNENNKFYAEFDKVFENPNILTDEKLMRQHFNSKEGQEFVDNSARLKKSGALEEYEKIKSFEEKKQWTRKYMPDLAAINDQYDCWIDYDDLPDE